MKVAVVIRLSAFGDVLLTGPAIRALAETFRVVFVTDPQYAAIAATFPGVSEVRSLDHKLGIGGARRLGAELRSLSPALVIDLQNKARTAVLARTIGAPTRTLIRRTWGQALSALFGRDTILNDEHQAQRYLRACVPSAGADHPLQLGPLQVPEDWHTAADAAAQAAGWDGTESPLAVAPAATHKTKGWPIERYAETVRRLASPGTPLLLVAGPRDTEAVLSFRLALGDWPRLLDSSKATLPTMVALLSRCQLLLGNDSGPIHLATALGVPTVAAFGPTSPRRWGPLPGADATHRVARLNMPCAPCSNHGGPKCPQGHHDCLGKLAVETVAMEALIALGRSS